MSGGGALRLLGKFTDTAEGLVLVVEGSYIRPATALELEFRAALAETPESRETLDVELVEEALSAILPSWVPGTAIGDMAADFAREYAALRSPDTETAE